MTIQEMMRKSKRFWRIQKPGVWQRWMRTDGRTPVDDTGGFTAMA